MLDRSADITAALDLINDRLTEINNAVGGLNSTVKGLGPDLGTGKIPLPSNPFPPPLPLPNLSGGRCLMALPRDFPGIDTAPDFRTVAAALSHSLRNCADVLDTAGAWGHDPTSPMD